MARENITDEFGFLMEEEDDSTYEDDSNKLIEKASEFRENTNLYPDRTYQGITVTSINNCMFIGKSDIMPWEHVKFTIDVNQLKDVNNDRLLYLTIPYFVEELESIGDRAETEFGYNQSHRNAIKEIFINKNIVVIAPNTFAFYKNLEKIKFEDNCKLMYLGAQAFACCEKLQLVDLQNCKYLEEIRENTFVNSAVKTLKISSNINSICSLENTNIETVYIDNEKYDINTFNDLMKNSDSVFWEHIDNYDF